MTENAQFAEFLDHALALALHDDTDECLEEAGDYIRTTDDANGWNGALVEAWSDRWRPHADERIGAAMWGMSARLQEMLKE